MSTNTYDYDVLYLGSGHGTFDGAIPLAAQGVKVAVVESGLVGGTCPNRGCNAKITLEAPAALANQVSEMQGLVNPALTLNWQNTVAHKHEVIDALPEFIADLMKDNGIALIKGRGHFIDSHTIIVNGEKISAEKFVIATGMHPHQLDLPGRQIVNNSNAFMNLKKLPKRIAIIGAGYIGMEFASIASAFGSQVTVIMRANKALRRFHQPFVEKIITKLNHTGVTFIKNANINSFSDDFGNKAVHYNDTEKIEADWILDATGRIPNTTSLGLEKIGVDYDKDGIIVNDYLQTTIPHIYASGDVIKKKQPKLTPTAIFESLYLMKTFTGATKQPIVYPAIPSTVFTTPRIARVGITPEEAAEDENLTVSANNILDNWYRNVEKEAFGENKLVYTKSHQLVGATEISNHAEDVINTLLPAIELKLTPEQVGRIIHIFPTIGSAAWENL
ncbi:dihydrolipoyl dehydrogenase family protein [Liquorilactobacillus mali]|uniref:dihydrolipoyl dehydrogenase family protein n=1 Tax=Liquorilactobacillus mali TaxID=1618 RepID=UPI00235050DE|nr:NAD(P)/FAD-dependent oxidoreductase [Liquorilactobacillus mali]MDC7953822.1 NAD(P)/FAD-dependent oxidoreductase [Liquorilactobacillus mali]